MGRPRRPTPTAGRRPRNDEVTERLLDAAPDQFCRMGIRRSTMEDVARRAGVSRITAYRRFATKDALVEQVVRREFRRYFGMSVGSYLRHVRTERAAHLLRHSKSDITEIALGCGFASHAHLCRVFKVHFGLTPTEYRAKH